MPGYGIADVVLQGLGGWFAFGLHDFLSSKTLIQTELATAAPVTARIGRELAASTPQEPISRGGAPIFRYGSGSSDVLHALLEHRVTPFRLLVGHSKGALQINNAIQSLPVERTRGLRVVTLGCPIGENVAGVNYHQYLGLFDALGQLNAWGHWPEHWPPHLAQHQSRVAAVHGSGQDNFRVGSQLKRSEPRTGRVGRFFYNFLGDKGTGPQLRRSRRAPAQVAYGRLRERDTLVSAHGAATRRRGRRTFYRVRFGGCHRR